MDLSTPNLYHCTACRTTIGMLCSTYYPLQTRPQNLDNLREYQQFEYIVRYFCNTCDAYALACSRPSERYFVASGLLVDNGNTHRTRLLRHWRTSETRDGGLTSFLTGEQHLPWPDLLVPYYTHSSENTTDVKWWLREANIKYLTGTCACPSCRLASGCPIQPWAFIPKANLFDACKAPLAFGAGTMQRYESSPGVYREFCKHCGASVFWSSDQRPLLIDVSVGLLRSPEESRASQ
ncbi:GFA family protein [Aspergillus homomorphus CBS 101889]|uniref:CENP-V/GFA domain-containing protein n=1 Tax=Aspergillus homomorphus (strain CBS 101889) TaxID=1450537 RepID=A0A395I6X0_ASPHC|nr:hypothetical protein BO97DRAFT_468521 [Aspergillus homomorphus CBS 101889]RAL15645.1 hypothetical protein BO97DRAFT_468521 [Aspergillus homomorphus CBS 101889]